LVHWIDRVDEIFSLLHIPIRKCSSIVSRGCARHASSVSLAAAHEVDWRTNCWMRYGGASTSGRHATRDRKPDV
jgi:hypothetical protein